MKTTKILLVAVLLASAMPALAGKFYKWVDDQGVTHYDAKPPAGERASEPVRIYSAPSSDQAEALDRLKQRRQASASAEQAAQRQAREADRLRSEPNEVQKERCAQQRKNLEVLTNRPTVRVKNPDTGAMEVIDQERRAALLEDTRKALEFCAASNG